MEYIRVLYDGKEYIILNQFATGYCEIVEEGSTSPTLVHFSELKPV